MSSTSIGTNKNVTILKYAGTYIGTVIGAGFASGQEVLQFFTGFGYIGILGTLAVVLLFAWYGSFFMKMGHELKADSHGPILTSLCGKYVGRIMEWILTFFLFGVVAIMISGGGATLTQYYGLNPYVGKVIMAVLVIGTVLLGLNSALSALGILAPIIIITTLFVGLSTLFGSLPGLSEAGEVLKTLKISTSTSSWWSSALIYVSYCVLPAIPVLATIGSQEKDINVLRKSGIIGGLALGLSAVLLNLALLSRLDEVVSKEVPILELAGQIWPVLGFVFSFILIAAIFTTAVPLLYGFTARFAKEGTTKFKWLTIIVGIAAFIAGLFPFGQLVGVIYPLLGYMGLVVMAAAVYRTLKKKKKVDA